jgi:hypothetical protein
MRNLGVCFAATAKLAQRFVNEGQKHQRAKETTPAKK